ncbi:MAG: hypothetical protein ACLR56_13375 [Oscillospiraceae bacterium]
MKILIIRHGDPDYEIDSVTEKGKREVMLLRDRLLKQNIGDICLLALRQSQSHRRTYIESPRQNCRDMRLVKGI